MEFKNILQELLKEKQMNYNQLSKETGIPVTTLSNYINRNSTPSIYQLEILSKYFNTTIDLLIGKEKKENKTIILNSKENKLLKFFSLLSEDEKDKIIEDCEYFANKNTKINTYKNNNA